MLKEYMNFYGIDPGIHGALAYMYPTAHTQVLAFPLKDGKMDWPELSEMIRGYCVFPGIITIEQAWPHERQGACSAYTMGVNWGYLYRCLEATKCTVQVVSPQKWKKFYWPERKLSKELTQLQRKKIQKADSFVTCDLLEPHLTSSFRKGDDGKAEAVLMAHYGKKNYEASLSV